MLLLLPPSETKAIGGANLPIRQVHLSYGQQDPARDLVLQNLLELCKDEAEAQRVLKLSAKQLDDIQRNREILTAPTLPAYLRYSGTLYKAIQADKLSESAVAVMRSNILIQSSLFGLISATDRIPWYRLSATTKLPNLDIKQVWREYQPKAWERLVDFPIIDLRSKSYVHLSPVPKGIESYWVEVVSDSDGERKALNHFNKTAKGELVGAFVRAGKLPSSIKGLKKLAGSVNLGLEVEGDTLILITSEVLR